MADKKLFALCVGINEYPEGVSNLAGCITDAENWKNFIETHYQKSLSPEILLLTNAQATRAGFIDAFRNHLGQARDGDTVFLHYSGHGSREKAPPAYLKFFPDGMNETLVLSDSRAKDDDGNYTGYDLADKELGRLLEEVVERKPNLNLIVSLDCCHSGSGTRDAAGLAKSRLTGDRADEARSFDTYIPGIFTGGEVVPPSSKHVLLASCSQFQKAWETKEKTGLFTTSVMEVLEKYGPQTNITDLYTRTRTVMRKTTNNQNPQLEAYEQYNTNQIIFTGGVFAGSSKYAPKIYHVDNSWKLDFGAIHGMPNDREIDLAVYSNLDDISKGQEESLGLAKSVQVSGDKTTVSIDFDGNVDKEYYGEFLTPPVTPMTVFIYGAQAGYESILKQFEGYQTDGKQIDGYKTMFFQFERVEESEGYQIDAKYADVRLYQYFAQVSVTDKEGNLITPKAGDYFLVAHDDHIFLLDENNRLIQGLSGGYQSGKGIRMLFDMLDRIAQWENLVRLQNKKSKIDPGKVDFTLYDEDEQPLEGNEFTFYLREVDGDWTPDIGFVLPKIKNNTKQALYCSYIYMNDTYITLPENSQYIPAGAEVQLVIGKDEDTNEPLTQEEIWLPSYNDDGVKPALNEELNRYFTDQSLTVLKLLVSTEKLDEFTLKQDGIDIGYISDGRGAAGRSRGPRSRQVKNDWFTKTIMFRIVRQSTRLEGKDITLGDNDKISIKGNTSITGGTKLSNSNPGSRSTDKTSVMTSLLGQQEGDLVNFGGQVGGTNILEINDIQGAEKLAENPLEITLNEEVSEDEMLLPLTFDGEHILSIGETETLEDGSTNIAIDDIPAVEEGSRSANVGRSLKLAFYKIALKRRPDKIYQLAWVEYLDTKDKNDPEKKKEKEIERHRDNDEVAEKVANANKVLLLLHGIIGDTEDMAIAVKDMAAEKGYDLVLSFDYENLNSSIEKDISWSLKDQLERVGFKADDGKELHILAQGMGCLVARWMVERRGGNAFVNQMILVGPPNAGSVLGNLESYRKMSTMVLGVVANVALPFLGWAGGLLKGVTKALKQGQKLTTTLAEMHEGSAFIRDLNDSDDPKVPYAIVAGDVRKYEPADGSNFSKFQEKMSAKLGTFVNGGDANDMIVDYDSMKRAGKNSQVEITKVVCHHLNYFQEDASLEAIKNFL